MIKNQFFTLLFSLILFNSLAQNNCPQGYEERNVRCGTVTTIKCIPINYSCAGCWTVFYPNFLGGKSQGVFTFNSYNSAVNDATGKPEIEYIDKSSGRILYDRRGYKIVLTDNNFCNTSVGNNSYLKEDLKRRINSFLIRYKDEILNCRNRFNLNLYAPGAVSREYQRQIEMAQQDVKELERLLNQITDENISIVQRTFEEAKKNEENLIKVDNNYKSAIQLQNNEKIKEEKKKEEERQKTIEQQILQNKQQEQFNKQHESDIANINEATNLIKSNIQQRAKLYSKLTQEQNILDREKTANSRTQFELENNANFRDEAKIIEENLNFLRTSQILSDEFTRTEFENDILKSKPAIFTGFQSLDTSHIAFLIFYHFNYESQNLYTLIMKVTRTDKSSWMTQSDFFKFVEFNNGDQQKNSNQIFGPFKTRQEAINCGSFIDHEGRLKKLKTYVFEYDLNYESGIKKDQLLGSFWKRN